MGKLAIEKDSALSDPKAITLVVLFIVPEI